MRLVNQIIWLFNSHQTAEHLRVGIVVLAPYRRPSRVHASREVSAGLIPSLAALPCGRSCITQIEKSFRSAPDPSGRIEDERRYPASAARRSRHHKRPFYLPLRFVKFSLGVSARGAFAITLYARGLRQLPCGSSRCR